MRSALSVASVLSAFVFAASVASTGPASAQEFDCVDSVQGKIAWDGASDRRWTAQRLSTLCTGAEGSREPGRCFQEVMSGSVDWGGSTNWNPTNALRLCAGTTDSDRRIACFREQIGDDVGWSRAIDVCTARDADTSSLAVAAGRVNLQDRVGRVTLPPGDGQPPAQTNEGAGDRRNWVRITCRGPMPFRAYRVQSGSNEGVWQLWLDFEGTDAASLAPGQCRRESSTGFDFPRALDGDGRGRLVYDIDYLKDRPLFTEVTVDAGVVTDYTTALSGFDRKFADAGLRDFEEQFYVSARWTNRGGQRGIPMIYEVRSVNR